MGPAASGDSPLQTKDLYDTHDGFIALRLIPAGHHANQAGRTPESLRSPPCRLSDFRRRSGRFPALPYPPLKHSQLSRDGDAGPGPSPAHNLRVNMNLEPPPQRQAGLKLEPHGRDARLLWHLAFILNGCPWVYCRVFLEALPPRAPARTAPGGAGRSFGVAGLRVAALVGPIEPNRCLAGLLWPRPARPEPSPSLPLRN